MNWKDRLSLSLYRNPLGFRSLEMKRRLLAPREWQQRRRAALGLESTLPDIPKDKGFRWVGNGELPRLTEVLHGLQKVARDLDPHLQTLVQAQPARYRSCIELLSDEEVERVPGLLELACSVPILTCVARYLGAAPCLSRVALGYSPGTQDPEHGGSQTYHADGEDRSQVKLFILVTRTGMQQGPLHLVPADASQAVLARWGRGVPNPPHARMRAGGFSDEQVLSCVDPGSIVHHVGEPGRALLADTSRCLHFGSRVTPGHDRFSLMLAYRRFHVVNATPTNRFGPVSHLTHPLQRLALANPRNHPPGYFFPDRLAFPGPEYRGVVESSGPHDRPIEK